MVKRFEDFGKAMGVTADPEDWNREYLRLLGDCGNVLPGAVELLAALKPNARWCWQPTVWRIFSAGGSRDQPHRPLSGRHFYFRGNGDRQAGEGLF